MWSSHLLEGGFRKGDDSINSENAASGEVILNSSNYCFRHR